MRVGVTGANGAIGKFTLERLRQAGHHAVPLVRNPAGLQDEHVIGDITMPLVQRLPLLDAIVHLAALTHIQQRASLETDNDFSRVNVTGTQNILAAAAVAGIQHFVFVSSVKVHGETSPNGQPYTEASALSPMDAYARSKVTAEKLVNDYCRQSDISFTIVRPPLVYGKDVGPNFQKLAKLAKSWFPLPLGDINNARSLIYVENLADFIVNIAANQSARNKTFLVSDGTDVSTSELLKMLAWVQGRQARLWSAKILRYILLLFGMNGIHDRLFSDLQIDTSLARRKLAWYPPYSVSDALAKSTDTRVPNGLPSET